MAATTETRTLTVKQLHELALQVAGGMGPVIEQEIMNLCDGKLPEGYAFPSEKAVASTNEILARFGIPTDLDDDGEMQGAPIDHSTSRIVSDGEEYLILASYEDTVSKVEAAKEDGEMFVVLRCPTQYGAVLSSFKVSSITRVFQKIAPQT